MIRADAVASSRKENSRDDGCDINALHHDEQKIAAKYAIRQQQQATISQIIQVKMLIPHAHFLTSKW
jgi:hypothetical protein